MTQILSTEKQGLVFEIISARISEEPEDKKYVIYTLQIRFITGSDDLSPSVIERRYTQFASLYNVLKKGFPSSMTNIVFPKKVLTGNFDNELISARSSGFESLLKHISGESKLRTSKAMQIFLQEPEIMRAKELLDEKNYREAYTILENTFKLVNKVFSDRSHAVILTLCRLVACSAEIPASLYSLKWADLALYRFDGVSDSDILELYVPLLHTCIKIYYSNDKNKDELETQLQNFQRQGVKNIEGRKNLFTAVNEVEEKVFKQ